VRRDLRQDETACWRATAESLADVWHLPDARHAALETFRRGRSVTIRIEGELGSHLVVVAGSARRRPSGSTH